MLKREDVTYVNISATRHTIPTIEAQGFCRYSRGQFVVVPNSFSRKRSPRIILAGTYPGATFDSNDQHLLLAHAGYGCISLWCVTSENAYPFVFRHRLIRGFIPCAQLIYCSDIDDYFRFANPIGRFLAGRGSPVVIVDSNGAIPGLAGMYC